MYIFFFKINFVFSMKFLHQTINDQNSKIKLTLFHIFEMWVTKTNSANFEGSTFINSLA